MKKLLVVVFGLTLLQACEKAPAPPPPEPTPPISTYPQAPTVSAEDLARALPKDAEGRPILATIDGTPLTIGPKRADAIGAAATCSDFLGGCIQVTKDSDACVTQLPRCTTTTPWLESAACCPAACVAAYQEQRALGATALDAGDAVFGSTHECFPGLQEKYRAAGGTPYLAPRRTR